MATSNGYVVLAQYSADCSRAGLVKTAEVIDREHAQLLERFGPPVSVHSLVRDRTLDEMLNRLRLAERRALAGNQHGIIDRATALIAQITMSAVARLIAEGAHVLPQQLASAQSLIEGAVTAAFERIEAQRGAEARLAAFVREQRWQETRRAAMKAQERERLVAELKTTQARLETALAQ